MAVRTFVDTNILVYARDAAEPDKQPRAAQWLRALWQARTGRLSAQVLSEYYVIVTRKLRPGLAAEDAWDDVRALMAWRPQPLDIPVLERGRAVEQRFRLSWWDSLIVAAAQVQGCSLLLSEDLQDGAVYGTVTVCNPFDSALAQPDAPYEIAAFSAPVRHRPRGRPRRSMVIKPG